MTTTTRIPTTPTPTARLLRRWPAMAGLGFAALVVLDLAGGVDLAPVLAASAVVYLGAAAVGRRSAAWPMFALTVVVITAARFVLPFDATWAVLATGVPLLV